tara:strand:- start:394815 stop:394919 length:105 start_codon:yes stop_codon:yes gene_type:complete
VRSDRTLKQHFSEEKSKMRGRQPKVSLLKAFKEG